MQFILRVFIIFFLSLTSTVSSALSLKQVYEQAKTNTATIKTKVFDEQKAEATKSQAWSEVLPKVEVSSSSVWRDEQVGISVTSSFGQGYQHTAQMSLSQPLFRGGAEYHLLVAAKKEPLIAKYQTQQAEIDLYTQLADLFYQWLNVEADQKSLKEQAELLDTRLKYLRRRAAIGRSKQTEVLSATAQRARIDAEFESSLLQKLKIEETIKNYSGIEKIDSLEDPLNNKPNWAKGSLPIHLENVPSLKAAELLVEKAKAQMKAAWSGFLPEVNFTGNYYLDRAGVLADSEWDATINAKWELFSGGKDRANVRLTYLESEKLSAEFADLKRRQKTTYEQLKESLKVKIRESEKLKTAVAASLKNYRQHIKESQSSLVSDLDVLRALDDYLQIKRAYDRSHFEAKNMYFKLRQAVGVETK